MANSEDYNLTTDRRVTERRLVSCLIRFPELCEKFPEDLVKNYKLRVICEQIKALFRRDGFLSRDVLESFAIPRLVDSLTTEDSAVKAIRELFEYGSAIECQTSFHLHLEQLKALKAKDVVLNIVDTVKNRINTGEDIRKVCATGNELLEICSSLTNAQQQVSVGDAFESLMSNIYEARALQTDIGVPYPIASMANSLGTMYPSDLVVVAARPAVGKTALALNFCRFTDEPMGFISSEMAKEQLAMRFVAMDAGIPANRIRDAKNLTDFELEKISECHTQHKGRKLYIEEKGGIHIGEIEDAAEAWVSLYGVKVLMVDYVQRINSDKKHSSESERIGHVTKRLKELAKKLGICIVLLAQINRDAVKGERRPQVHDLKGSGDIEQEADTIILMHKPSMGSQEQNGRCTVEMIIDKNRHGPVGLVVTEYIAHQVMFVDPSTEVLSKYKNIDV